MATLKIELDHPLWDGETITFQAPCDCTAVDEMLVCYPNDAGTEIQEQTFVFTDAHGNKLTGVGNLFMTGSLVSVMVKMATGSAYLVNADTNKYLEDQLASKYDFDKTEKLMETYLNLYMNRTGGVTYPNTDYTTYMARGEALFSSETNPTINGTIAWWYE